METTVTQKFNFDFSRDDYIKKIIDEVYSALAEKGYEPITQMVGYILSGEPTYITSHKGARSLIMKVERDEIMEYLLKFYINNR